jgi:hypothetical protein
VSFTREGKVVLSGVEGAQPIKFRSDAMAETETRGRAGSIARNMHARIRGQSNNATIHDAGDCEFEVAW